MTFLRRPLGILAVLSCLIVPALASGGAPYHTELTGTYPAADSTHGGEIGEVRLRFSTAVQPALSAITVVGESGAVGAGAVEAVPGTESSEIRIVLSAPLPSGAYTVEWRSAGPDSHVIRGSFGFSVSGPAPAPEETQPRAPSESERGPVTVQRVSGGSLESPAGPSLGTVAVGWTFLVALVGMIGTVAFRLAVVGPFGRAEGHEEAAGRLRRGSRTLGWLAVALAIFALPLRFLGQARLLSGPGGDPLPLAGQVLGSAWGTAWLLELSGTALFLIGLLMTRGKLEAKAPWLVCGLGALLAATVPGLSGHAAVGGAPWVAVDTVHVLAAGIWLGGLACLVLVGIRGATRGEGPSTLAPLVARFSVVALPAVALLVVTGVANVLDRIALADLVGSAYGRTLLIKILAAVGAFSLGFYNWRVVRPALAREGRRSLIGIPASVELSAGLVVLALTAALVVTALP